MENPSNPENRETFIERRILEVAEAEGMDVDDIFSDIATFVEILEGDENARFYFEELAEKVGVSTEEMIKYASTDLQSKND